MIYSLLEAFDIPIYIEYTLYFSVYKQNRIDLIDVIIINLKGILTILLS